MPTAGQQKRQNQQREQTSSMKLIQNSTKNTINTLTFLKSNYKYKRRTTDAHAFPLATETPQTDDNGTTMCCCNQQVARSVQGQSALRVKTSESENKAYDARQGSGRKDNSSDIFTFSIILNLIQRKLAIHSRRHVTRVHCINWLSICLTFFIALFVNSRDVHAGACWQTALGNGKCNEIYSLNITKSECCSNQEFSYTDRELNSVEYFFATAIGGGMECAPCIESCKNVNCGPNRKCVKRKGRPKCICAPECGAASRRKKHQLQQQQQQPKEKHFRGHEHHNEYLPAAELRFGRETGDVGVPGGVRIFEKSPRDVRSLSREITNINLDIADGIHPSNTHTHTQAHIQYENQNQNQRKLMIMQSQRSQTSQQKPQLNKSEPKSKRLLLAANVDKAIDADTPTNTRRIQIISNIRKHRNGSKHRNVSHRGDGNATTPSTGSLPERAKEYPSNRRRNRTNDIRNTNRPYQQARIRHVHQNIQNIDHDAGDDLDADDVVMEEHVKRKQHHDHHRQFRRKHNNTIHNNQSGHTRELQDPHDPHMNATVSTMSSGEPAQRSTTSTDAGSEITFQDGIYEKFNQHGFPNQYHEITFDNTHHLHPVCGTDGRTYNTECQLKKRACRTNNPNLQVAYRGYCKITCSGVKCLNGLTCVEDHYTIPHCIECKIDCPQDDDEEDAADVDVEDRARNIVIDPSRAVCGVDGKTYQSACAINRMICKIGRSIAVAYPGPCRADRVTCSDITCGPKQKCLVDLLTHEPRCVQCRYKCSRKRRPTSLRFEEGKICGVNNRTYNSWCEMRKDSCTTGFFIDVKSPGECQ